MAVVRQTISVVNTKYIALCIKPSLYDCLATKLQHMYTEEFRITNNENCFNQHSQILIRRKGYFTSQAYKNCLQNETLFQKFNNNHHHDILKNKHDVPLPLSFYVLYTKNVYSSINIYRHPATRSHLRKHSDLMTYPDTILGSSLAHPATGTVTFLVKLQLSCKQFR